MFRTLRRLHSILKHIERQSPAKPLFPGIQKLCMSTVHQVNEEFVRNWLLSPSASALLGTTNNLGLRTENVVAALEKAPELSSYNTMIWQGHYLLLSQFNISGDEFLTMITICPEVLDLSESMLEDCLTVWSACQFRNLCHPLLINHPSLLTIKVSKIETRVQLLHSYCDSRRQVAKLIMRAPSVMFDSHSVVEDKFKYLQLEMRIERSEIVSTGALEFDLTDIKTRHMCLYRAGLFKPVNPKVDVMLNTNPSLKDILLTADHYFATKVAKITPFEFEVFQDMFLQDLKNTEKEEDEEEITDSDYDSD